jgi:hypothetical protein
MGAVSADEVDRYLDALEEPKRATLAQLRQTILDLLPEADQGMSYGVPAFRVRGKTIAGFAVIQSGGSMPCRWQVGTFGPCHRRRSSSGSGASRRSRLLAR